MKKNQYIAPSLHCCFVEAEAPLAVSNMVDGNSINMNSRTMESGDGSDAVKGQGNYSVWDDDWSK